jgi:hypothetical protein
VGYAAQTVSEVQKRWGTLADQPASERYDWITCSHVLKHVADPLQIVQTLSSRSAADGVIYIEDFEVPTEMWGRAPLHEELVTHDNFLSPASLRHLLQRAGLAVPVVRLGSYLHPCGRSLFAVRASARRGHLSPDLTPPGDTETRQFLNPGLRERMSRYALTPRNLLDALGYNSKKLVRMA